MAANIAAGVFYCCKKCAAAAGLSKSSVGFVFTMSTSGKPVSLGGKPVTVPGPVAEAMCKKREQNSREREKREKLNIKWTGPLKPPQAFRATPRKMCLEMTLSLASVVAVCGGSLLASRTSVRCVVAKLRAPRLVAMAPADPCQDDAPDDTYAAYPPPPPVSGPGQLGISAATPWAVLQSLGLASSPVLTPEQQRARAIAQLVMERLCVWGEYRTVTDWPLELVGQGAMPAIEDALRASPTHSLTIPQIVTAVKERTGNAHGGKALDMLNLKAYVRCFPALFHLRSGRTAAGRPLDVVELRIEAPGNDVDGAPKGLAQLAQPNPDSLENN